MTIRLKLTLIYSIIIALILIIFSAVLYSTQRWSTLNTAHKSVNYHFNKTLEAQAFTPIGSHQASSENSSQSYSQVYVQLRNGEGQIIQGPANLENAALPLSSTGLQAVHRGEEWVEAASLDGGRFLVQSEFIESPGATPQILQVAISLEDRYQFLGELRNILIVADSLVVIVAFGIGWVLAGVTLRPIHQITQTAKTVGEKRDFSRRVEHPGPNDEIGQLATTFNAMLTRLQEAYVQVEQSLQAQRRFVADASHELRTPLTTIRGNIGLLQREPPINIEERADILADTVDETERLIRLVNDLLVLARADAQQPLQRQPLQVAPLLDDVCRQVKLLAPQRTLECHIEPNLTLTADADALKQVLLVLLDNALKHTPPEAVITLKTSATHNHISISVGDNGPGIKQTQLPQIFDRFYRGDTARSGPGTGLGLAIANELTKAQNGTLEVESQAGQGTVFTLKFPKPSSTGQDDKITPSNGQE